MPVMVNAGEFSYTTLSIFVDGSALPVVRRIAGVRKQR